VLLKCVSVDQLQQAYNSLLSQRPPGKISKIKEESPNTGSEDEKKDAVLLGSDHKPEGENGK